MEDGHAGPDVTMEENSKLAGSMNGTNGNFSGGIALRQDDSTATTFIDADDLTYIAKRSLTHRRDTHKLKYHPVSSLTFRLFLCF
jgi:hypothetical protein